MLGWGYLSVSAGMLREARKKIRDAGMDAAVHIPIGPRGNFDAKAFDAALSDARQALTRNPSSRLCLQSPLGILSACASSIQPGPRWI